MKQLFIEAKSNIKIEQALKRSLKLLPKKVGIATTAQHKHLLKQAESFLNKNNIKSVIAGQVLGCNANSAKKIKDKVDAFLYIGSGRFHPIRIALETEKKVIMANPFTNEAKILEQEEILKVQKQQKGALLKFLTSNHIGLLVSTKPGQNHLNQAIKLKEKLKDKNCYIFLADTINPEEFQNFPFIESWVNTACPRFADEKKGVLNYENLKEVI